MMAADVFVPVGYACSRMCSVLEVTVPPDFRLELVPLLNDAASRPTFTPSATSTFRLHVRAARVGLLGEAAVMDAARSFQPRATMDDGWTMNVGILEDDYRMGVAAAATACYFSPIVGAWHYYGVNLFALYLPDCVVDSGTVPDPSAFQPARRGELLAGVVRTAVGSDAATARPL